MTAKLVDWLKNYTTSDGKPQNRLKQDEPTTAADATAIIREVRNTLSRSRSLHICLECSES